MCPLQGKVLRNEFCLFRKRNREKNKPTVFKQFVFVSLDKTDENDFNNNKKKKNYR